MKVKIVGGSKVEAMAWGAVKAYVVLLMVWLVMSPISQTMAGRVNGGLTTVLPGRIRATKITPVTMEFTAQAVSVAVKAGQAVEAGQLLAVLESPEVNARLERAQTRFDLAGQRLNARPDTARRLWQEQHRSAEQRLQEARVRQGGFSTQAAEVALARAEKDAASLARMVTQKLATAQDLELAHKQVESEQANLNNARNTLTRLKQDVSAADSQLRMVMIQKDIPDPSTDPAFRLDYEDARTALDAADRQKTALRLLAPHAGTVLSVSVEVGAQAGGWAPLFLIADLKTLRVEVPVTARVAQMIKAGAPVSIAIPGDPPWEVQARVGELQMVPDQLQHSHLVRIPISNAGGSSILVGMECAVSFPHGGIV